MLIVRWIVRVLKITWLVYFFILFLIFLILFYPLFYVLLSKKKWYATAHKLRRIWGYIILYPSGLLPSKIYEEKIDLKKGYVIVANHFSYMDIVSLSVQLPLYFRFMAKIELSKIPLFGMFFRTIDIPVDRSSRKSGAKAYQICLDSLKDNIGIGIFPEGKIGKTVPQMGPFKAGAFKMAIETETPILPISILNNWKRIPGGLKTGGTPGPMKIIIHKPIPTIGKDETDIVHLQKQVYNTIQNSINNSL